MMARVPLPLIGPSYQGRSDTLGVQTCKNLYLEKSEVGGKTDWIMVGSPGMNPWVTLTLGSLAIRGMHFTSTGVLYVVRGDTVLTISSLGVETSVGTIGTTFGLVSMADNGTQLIIVDGTSGYTVALASPAVVAISDPDFPAGCKRVDFQDGYFIAVKEQTGTFYISGLYDGTAWDPLDFEDASGRLGRLVVAISNERDLWLMGRDGCGVYYHSGDLNFPFSSTGNWVEAGCAAAHSVAKIGGSVFWLGASKDGHGSVFMSRGYSPIRISTHAIEKNIESWGSMDDCSAYTYRQEGHQFYVLTSQTGDKTWCFDLSTMEWSERTWRDTSTGYEGRHRALVHCFAYNKNLVSDIADGVIYEYDLDKYSDRSTDDPIVRERTTPPVHYSGQRFATHLLEVEMEKGVGLVTGQGSDPQIMLQVSNDGGKTWGAELWRSIGAIGEWRTKVIWRQLGISNNRAYRFRITDPVKVVFLGAWMKVEVLDG